MPKITLEEGQEFEVFPEDTVIKVEVEEYEVREYEGSNGPWEKLNFKFKILEVYNAEYKSLEGQNIWGGVSFRFTDHPDNKLKQWVEALLGFELSIGYELDVDDLVGRQAKAITSTYTKKGTTTERHQVEALIPIEDGVTTAASAAATPAATEQEIPF